MKEVGTKGRKNVKKPKERGRRGFEGASSLQAPLNETMAEEVSRDNDSVDSVVK